jgi:hypothetical protein
MIPATVVAVLGALFLPVFVIAGLRVFSPNRGAKAATRPSGTLAKAEN